MKYLISGLYRIGLLDIDINNRSDRIEWGHLKHHSLFSPLQAFELISQWLCATGSVVADLVFYYEFSVGLEWPCMLIRTEVIYLAE